MTTTLSGNESAKNNRWNLSERGIVNLFIWPTLILLILWNIFPLFYSLYLSFTNYSAIAKKAPIWIGFKNFETLLTSDQIWGYFATTGKFALMAVVFETLVGFALAMLVREKFKGSGLLTTLILVPMMLSPVVVGLFWGLIYNPGYGIFNYLVSWLGIPLTTDWLANSRLALWAVVITDVWMWSPFVMLLVLSGLTAIPDYLYEAAVIDRASAWFQFRRITLPQVAPLLLIAVLFRTMEAFKSFDLIMGLTGWTWGGDSHGFHRDISAGVRRPVPNGFCKRTGVHHLNSHHRRQQPLYYSYQPDAGGIIHGRK